ncbi:MAG TPA: serine/threonine-protein kinase, partial [Longimicrobiales bacterium]|nr:serine/threonine-protein kinase [Longimicrobiales bacterium]
MTPFIERVVAALEGSYAVEREIGSGGAATVFLARDLKHQRPVAVKVLKPTVAAALGADRFLREIDIAAHLNHPHILPLHDSGEADGLLYYVTPFIEGESLKDRLDREGPVPVREAVRVAREVAAALEHAHRAGVVH